MECSLQGSSVHGSPRQEYWSRLPFPSSGDLPHAGIKPVSPALTGRFFITEPPGKPTHNVYSSFIQFSSVVALSCLTLCDPMDCTTPGFPVHHQLSELTQTQSIESVMPSNHLLSPSPPAFNLSQYQGLFKWVSSSHQVAKVLEFQLQHQSFQWIIGNFINSWQNLEATKMSFS